MNGNPSQAKRPYRQSRDCVRPDNIVTPGLGQESVWDYPRPPVVEPVTLRLYVSFAGIALADTTLGLRVLETSSPPVYYFPPGDVRTEFIERMVHTTVCEWKGIATYRNVTIRGRRQEAIGWCYDAPADRYEQLRGYFAFYAGVADACYVGSELVTPQPGDYFGGWVTQNIVGPFKGGPGTDHW